MNFLQIVEAAQAAFVLVKKYGPLEQAAAAAFQKGGWIGLVQYIESVAGTPGGPSLAEAKPVVAQLKACHS